MSFSEFVKPYPNGYEDGESGNTPVTAAILNTNYDGFLLALNSWASEMETSLNQKADTSAVGQAISTISGQLVNMQDAINQKSTVSISDLLGTGTHIGTITVNGTDFALYAPSGGGGGSSVVWNQIQQTGTKIAEVTIDGTTYDVYSPTPIDEISDLTDVSITNLQNGQILKWNSTTSKWENSNESGGGGTGGHTIIDENGNSMTARAGLQFVGGANVSDDATNNKTIVDLASVGGIDGVFIDVLNKIDTINFSNGSFSYTATQDCFVKVPYTSQGNTIFKLDNINYKAEYDSNIYKIDTFLLKKGQELKLANAKAESRIADVYGIQTGTTHSKFQPVIYSLEEQKIGVWTDGKPLYEKTFIYSNIVSLGNGAVFQTDLSNIDNGFVIGGKITEGTTEYVFPYVANNKGLGFKFEKSNNTFIAQGNDTFSNANLVIVIQYTKTTDTAGSGSWTPQGVPAIHYSEDEQFVGTYFGETLYQKTIVLESSVSVADSWTTIYTDALIGNIAQLVDVKYNNVDNKGVYGVLNYKPNGNNLQAVYPISGGLNVLAGARFTLQYTKSS